MATYSKGSIRISLPSDKVWTLSEETIKTIGRGCGWAVVALLLFTILTGYGITEFRIVTSFTFEILGKASSQRLHHYTDLPLIILLVIHVGTSLWVRFGPRR